MFVIKLEFCREFCLPAKFGKKRTAYLQGEKKYVYHFIFDVKVDRQLNM